MKKVMTSALLISICVFIGLTGCSNNSAIKDEAFSPAKTVISAVDEFLDGIIDIEAASNRAEEATEQLKKIEKTEANSDIIECSNDIAFSLSFNKLTGSANTTAQDTAFKETILENRNKLAKLIGEEERK